MSDQNSDPSRPFDPPAPPTAPPAPPPAPPAPPAAPEPQRPDVPQYGEYAPASAPSNPYGMPGYPAAGAPTPPAPPTAPGPYGATPTYGAPLYGAPAYAPLGRQRKTWDLVLTIVLLAMGAIGAFVGASSGLGLDRGVQQQYTEHGLGTYTGHNGAAIAILAISHLVLYVIAVGLSILSLTKKRTTFWIPLVIGVIAAIIFWSVLFGVIFGDSTLLNALTTP
ncbi:MAG: DUF6264 family protein [Pseudolysinimonas sp.]